MIEIKVFINEDAKKFLKDKKFLTINLKANVTWDVKCILQPSVSVGKPFDTSLYDEKFFCDFNIFISKEISKDSFIEIFLLDFLDTKNLMARLK